MCAKESVKAPQLGEIAGRAAKVKDGNSNSKRQDVKMISQSMELELSLSQQQSGTACKTGSLAGKSSCASSGGAAVWLHFLKLNPNIWAGEQGAATSPAHRAAPRSWDRSCVSTQPWHGQAPAQQLRGCHSRTTWLSGTAEGEEGKVFPVISTVPARPVNRFSIYHH